MLEHQDKTLKVFVIWEPVLRSDKGPPSEENLARVTDVRAQQYWDPGLLVSNQIVTLTNTYPDRFSEEHKKELARRNLIWDAIVLFKPGVRWEELIPFPDYSAGPVVDIKDQFSQELKKTSP